MKYHCTFLPYKQTTFFSNIVTDYVEQTQQLQAFYTYSINILGIQKAVENKSKSYTNRSIIVSYFNEEYANKSITEKQKNNIKLLNNENCFTITTAHQPNIFTGPLYFIYKILHAIKMANDLNEKLPQYKFVPVYYMGSEDADLDELGNISIQQKKMVWNTKQTGAVGRMKVDKNFIQLINEIESQIAVNSFGKELIEIFRNSYKLNNSIQHSTFELVNTLFGKYGLLVLIPDNINLKRAFVPTIEKELREQFSEKEVTKTVAEINKNYKLKQTGRDLNLFYLLDDKRERIEKINGEFIVERLDLKFTLDEMLVELNQHPERFSPNVILRPVFQETILPNAAFIGGGGEISYWLQLKSVFEKVDISFPPILLRNSFLLYSSAQESKLQKMSLSVASLFSNTEELFTQWVKQQTTNKIDVQQQITAAINVYNELKTLATQVDRTLQAHTESIAAKALKHIEVLGKKMIKAEKRKFADQKNQLINIKTALFHNNNLQERIENFSYFYSIYGKDFFEMILDSSQTFEQQFGLICVD